MNKLLLALPLFVFVNASFAAETDHDKPYVEIGSTSLTYKEGSYGSMPSNIRLIAGKNDGNVGYEGMLGFNSSSDSLKVGTVTADYKVNYIMGIYGKALIHLNDVELFGRLGWASFDQTVSAGNIISTESGRGLSYGLGVKYTFEKNINFNVDYMVYYPTRNNISLTGLTVGHGFSF